MVKTKNDKLEQTVVIIPIIKFTLKVQKELNHIFNDWKRTIIVLNQGKELGVIVKSSSVSNLSSVNKKKLLLFKMKYGVNLS